MKKDFVGVRIPRDLLAKIDEKGNRSVIINEALVKYFYSVELTQVLNKLNEIDNTLKILLEQKPIINLNLPESFRIPEPKRLGFWARVFRK